MTPGLYYNRSFLTKGDREEILAWLETIHPIWENRFSDHRPLPEGETQRQLLRPVYWLGNWQFACLDYYRPPKGVLHRCVRAEPFPPVLARLIKKVEGMARRMFVGKDMPKGWHLNTCLVNYYGSRLENGKRIDTARVGEHKDFEPGPVASISLGERAIFQFVSSNKPGERTGVVAQQWLDDGSLQLFGGDRWKKQLFHRVQRVDKRSGHIFPIHVENFEPRRLNFTFRYVPDEHVFPYASLPADVRKDVRDYMKQLAKHSDFFAREYAKGPK
jgi:DNA oxidative demethylase